MSTQREDMSVWHEKSDLFTSEAPILAHGCNTQGIQGAGVAAIMRKRYPEQYNKYVHLHATQGLELGTVQFCQLFDHDGPTQYIANCMTQEFTGTHKRQVNYEAVYNCFEELRNFAQDQDIRDIAMPQIGAGLGMADWNVIEAMLHSVFTKECGVRATYHTID